MYEKILSQDKVNPDTTTGIKTKFVLKWMSSNEWKEGREAEKLWEREIFRKIMCPNIVGVQYRFRFENVRLLESVRKLTLKLYSVEHVQNEWKILNYKFKKYLTVDLKFQISGSQWG